MAFEGAGLINGGSDAMKLSSIWLCLDSERQSEKRLPFGFTVCVVSGFSDSANDMVQQGRPAKCTTEILGGGDKNKEVRGQN